MALEILREILDSADCAFNYFCLSAPDEICPIDHYSGKNTCFIKKKTTRYCKNALLFGKGHICKCPVRIAIFEKYKI